MNKRNVLIASISLLSLCSCSGKPVNESKIIGDPTKQERTCRIDYMNDSFDNYIDSVIDFSAEYSASCLSQFKPSNNENTLFSPLTAYSVLAMASEATGGTTSEEILKALKADKNTLSEHYRSVFNCISREDRAETFLGDGSLSYKLHLSNSIWLDENVDFEENTVNSLADYYGAYSIQEDFKRNSTKANKDVTNFIKKETNNFLNVNLNLDSETLFVMLSCLYLKDLWNYDGSDISLADGAFDFKQGDSTIVNTKLMHKGYRISKIYRDEQFSSFYVSTYHNTNIYFILPNDGVDAVDVMSSDNIAKALKEGYEGVDEENKIVYHSSCSFPAYEAEFDKDVTPVLKKMGINSLFDEPDFMPLTKSAVYISQVRHVNKLKVDRKGIEGASIMAIVGAGAVGPMEGYTDVFEDFVVDKAFGFVVTTGYPKIPLFSGVVNTIDKI